MSAPEKRRHGSKPAAGYTCAEVPMLEEEHRGACAAYRRIQGRPVEWLRRTTTPGARASRRRDTSAVRVHHPAATSATCGAPPAAIREQVAVELDDTTGACAGSRPSTFWVISENRGTSEANSTKRDGRDWAFGLRTSSRRHWYQRQTRAQDPGQGLRRRPRSSARKRARDRSGHRGKVERRSRRKCRRAGEGRRRATHRPGAGRRAAAGCPCGEAGAGAAPRDAAPHDVTLAVAASAA